MTTRASRFWNPSALAWLVPLGLVLVFVGWDARRRADQIAELTRRHGVTVDTPAVDAASPTGLANGVRSLVLPGRAMDGYHWIMQSQQAVARGELRVRHVDYDGGPRGRDVHWAMPFRLYLTGLAALDHALRGTPWGLAIERAAVWSGPVLLLAALAILTPWLARRFSPVAAGGCAVGAIAAFPSYVDFTAGYPDHHGLVNLGALLGVLGLVAHDGTPARARRGVVLAGIAGGVGLWISAATEIPVLLGTGAGLLVLLWRERGSAHPSVWSREPELLRRWGLAGAATSLLAYLAEYAPADFAWRLEVNHPLHALAWLAAGEALCRFARVLRAGDAPARRTDLLAGLGALAGVAVLPATILLAPRTFQVAEPFLWRLHHDFIAEFEPLPDFLRQNRYDWQALGYVLPLLVLPPAAWLVWRRARAAEANAALTLALGPALLSAAMAWHQVRWWGLASVLLVPVVALGFRSQAAGAAPARRRIAWLAGGALLLAPGLLAAGRHLARAPEISPDDEQALAERDVAQWLRQRAGDAPVVVAGSPTVTTALIYFGGLRGLGTLYWENNAGLHAAARLYAARDEAAARAIIAENHVTHLVVVTWDGFEGIYTRLIRQLPAEAPIPADAFIARLLPAAVPPPWLRLLPFALPESPAFAGAQIRLYEVGPAQSPAAAAVHAADAALEAGDPARAARLLPVLAEFPDELPSHVARARILFQQNDAAGFGAALAQVTARLARARELPLEERVHLTTALAMAGRFDLAAPVLADAVQAADAASLRRLTPGTLVELLSLSAAADLPWPDRGLREFAGRLVPPARRSEPGGPAR